MSRLNAPADDDRVADVGDGRPHEQALIVNMLNLDTGRGRLGRVGKHDVELPRDFERIAAQAAKDRQRHRVLAIGANGHGSIFVRDRDAAQVGQADGLAVLAGDDPVFQLQGIVGLGVGQNLILEHLAVKPADRLEAVLFPQPIGHVRDRESSGHQGLGIDLHQDLANIPPLHRHVRDIGQPADPRPQVVKGIVMKRRRVAAAGDDERDDREDRGRLPLGDGGRTGRQLCPDLGHPGPNVVERLDHVGSGSEVDRQLGRAADRFGAHADHAQNDAHCLLDRPGHGHLDVLDGQARRLNDDHDPWEGHFGVDAAGHPEHRIKAERREQHRRQHDETEIGLGEGDKIDPAPPFPCHVRLPARP